MSIIGEIEQREVAKRTASRAIPDFGPGDTVRVNVKVVEGNRERIQAFEGVCIARKSAGINSAFTVRKISYGEGVERVFPLYSPRVDSIEVIRRGRVRRAKLYYLRGLRGKAARIAERPGQRAKRPVVAREGAGAVATAAEAFAAEDVAPAPPAEAAEAAGGGAPAAKAERAEKPAKTKKSQKTDTK